MTQKLLLWAIIGLVCGGLLGFVGTWTSHRSDQATVRARRRTLERVAGPAITAGQHHHVEGPRRLRLEHRRRMELPGADHDVERHLLVHGLRHHRRIASRIPAESLDEIEMTQHLIELDRSFCKPLFPGELGGRAMATA